MEQEKIDEVVKGRLKGLVGVNLLYRSKENGKESGYTLVVDEKGEDLGDIIRVAHGINKYVCSIEIVFSEKHFDFLMETDFCEYLVGGE